MKTDMLEAAVGVTTHHDGMSGSSKQAVADDYEQVLELYVPLHLVRVLLLTI